LKRNEKIRKTKEKEKRRKKKRKRKNDRRIRSLAEIVLLPAAIRTISVGIACYTLLKVGFVSLLAFNSPYLIYEKRKRKQKRKKTKKTEAQNTKRKEKKKR